MDKKMKMILVFAVIIIAIAIILWLATRKKTENGDIHPRLTESEYIETYGGYDIWYWEGRSNPYWVQFPEIRQWFPTLENAKSRIDDHN